MIKYCFEHVIHNLDVYACDIQKNEATTANIPDLLFVSFYGHFMFK